jgi:DNA topoisomerase 2-associated protein PAT1
VGRDFDFFGQTAKVSDAIIEEQARFARRQPPPKSVAATAASPPKPNARPARTGYEKYKEPSYIPDLQVNASLWGVAPKKATADARQDGQPPPASKAPAKKMMSLEEVESAMRDKSKKSAAPVPAQNQSQYKGMSGPPPRQDQPMYQQRQFEQPFPGHGAPQYASHDASQYSVDSAPGSSQPTRIDPSRFGGQQDTHAHQRQYSNQAPSQQQPPQPVQILQNPNRLSEPTPPTSIAQPPSQPKPTGSSTSRHVPERSFSQVPLVTHPEQLLQLSEDQRNAYLIEDAKRAKRNHKIHLLSKDNGLMTPQDKNFITRIQLQQLVTATGNPNDRGTDAALAEDFYYQVHTQIRGGSRQNPHQPLNNFAQTYLFQTGGRPGFVGRRHHRGGENHMQRMEQQVQRAVEAAKLKPKNKQLIIEGSLGKISFSNAKTPKPLLNIKRAESGQDVRRPQSGQGKATVNDRKHILRNVEIVYEILMQMEDLERQSAPITADSEQEDVQHHMEWTQQISMLNTTLWQKLGVMAPIDAK